MKTNDIREIKTESGRRVRLAEDLAHVARLSPRVPKFTVSRWLRTQPDSVLKALGEAALAVASGKPEGVRSEDLEDLHAVTLIGIQAELREPGGRLDPESYPRIAVQMLACVAAERCRRLGWVAVSKPPDVAVAQELHLALTDKGLREFVAGEDATLTPLMTMLQRGLTPSVAGS
jgi:hypothetical protein